MGHSGFLLFLALRGPVRFVLGLAAAVGLLGGLVLLVLTLSNGGFVRGVVGFGLLFVWWLAYCGRFEFDRAVLRRTPPDQTFYLNH